MTYTPNMGASVFPGYLVSADTPQALSLGGLAHYFKAAAAMYVGEAVYVSAANTVTKGATANKGKRAGVVVGGFKTGFRCMPEIAVGTQAAATGELVLVCFSGIVKVVSDGAITLGDALIFGGTAGRVASAAAITATAANPTQAATTQAADSIGTGAYSGSTPVVASAASGAIIVGGAITNGAITAGAVTVAGDGFRNVIGMALETAGGAAVEIRALLG